MELKIPSQEQAYWGLRAMKTVALADGVLDDSERHLLASIQRIFGTTQWNSFLLLRRRIWPWDFPILSSDSNWYRD
jgi:hypothetical protein